MSAEWQRLIESWVWGACVAEVSANKPGNVSPNHTFDHATVEDFIASAHAIAPIISETMPDTIGQTILRAIAATRDAVGHNTNLGIVLLLSPLAAVPESQSLMEGILSVTDGLTIEDAIATYQGIQLAAPGGLGDAKSQDVAKPPTCDLKSCMQLAADRDLIAAQYVNGFHEVLNVGVPLLQQTASWNSHQKCRTAWLAINLMSQFGDSLIQRKCGKSVSDDVRDRASKVLYSGWPHQSGSQTIYGELEQFLKQDGNTRNPGTTADMIAAIFFAALRTGLCRFNDLTNDLVFSNE